MKKIGIYLISGLLLLTASCVSQKRKDNTITISGAFALYPLVIQLSEEYRKENPQVRFNITGGGAGKGLADALSEVVDLGMFSREISPEEINKGTWWIGLAIDAVIPTISSENPHIALLKKRGMTMEEFRAVYLEGTVKDWASLLRIPGESGMEIYTRSDACGAAETFAKYLGGRQEDLKGIGIYGDPGLAEAVVNDPKGIGFNNTIFVYDVVTGKKREGIEVIPIDINGNGQIDPGEDFYESFETVLNAIATAVYPSPPARELYFVSHGKPKKQAVIDFLNWTLTDGQKYVPDAGYVPITEEKIKEYVEKLK